MAGVSLRYIQPAEAFNQNFDAELTAGETAVLRPNMRGIAIVISTRTFDLQLSYRRSSNECRCARPVLRKSINDQQVTPPKSTERDRPFSRRDAVIGVPAGARAEKPSPSTGSVISPQHEHAGL